MSKAQPPTFKSKENGELALRLTSWLVARNYACALRETDDGVVTITYAAEGGEGHIWPSLRINAGKIIFPAGSPEDLLFAFLEGQAPKGAGGTDGNHR